MNLEVKIIDKNVYNGLWSEPVPIEKFIYDPYDIEFEWSNGEELPYKDFQFFKDDYDFEVFINGLMIDTEICDKPLRGQTNIFDFIGDDEEC